MLQETLEKLEQKKQRAIDRKKKLDLRIKQLKASEQKKERKERARELIEIGAILTTSLDRQKVLRALQENPNYTANIQNYLKKMVDSVI